MIAYETTTEITQLPYLICTASISSVAYKMCIVNHECMIRMIPKLQCVQNRIRARDS